MFKKTELDDWWDRLDPKTKTYLKKQPLWHDSDMIKAAAIAGVIGFIVGIVVGYQWAWEPAVQIFRPLIG